MSRIQCQNLKFKLVLKAERVYCYDWADLVCVCVCPSDPMYTTSETHRLSLTRAQMLDYMIDTTTSMIYQCFNSFCSCIPFWEFQNHCLISQFRVQIFFCLSRSLVQNSTNETDTMFQLFRLLRKRSWANVRTGFFVPEIKHKNMIMI